jgi:hypothetical protein
MKNIAFLLAPVLIATASVSHAQAGPQDHQRHQASGQHEAAAGDKKCCCEEMMHKMMMEMMQKHQSTGASNSGQPAGSDAASKTPQDHKH